MKRIFAHMMLATFAALLCLGLIGCENTPEKVSQTEITHTQIKTAESKYLDSLRQLIDSADKNYEGTIKEWYYSNSFSGITTQVHTGESADVLSRLIGSLKETEESVPAICDALWDDEIQDPPEEVEVGTSWYQIGDTLYRETRYRNPNGSNFLQSLAKVSSHYGEGVVLETTDEFWRMFNLISAFHPMAYYSGSYADGTLEITHAYPGEDDISVIIKDFELGTVTNDLSTTENNILTVEITAATDRELTLNLNCARSSDHIFDIQKQTVSLKAGEPQIVRIAYRATTWDYQLVLYTQNTHIVIYFSSTKTA